MITQENLSVTQREQIASGTITMRLATMLRAQAGREQPWQEWTPIVQHGVHALDTAPGRLRTPRLVLWTGMAIVLVAAAGGAVTVLASITGSAPAHASLEGRTREPLAAAAVLSGSPQDIAASAATALFASAPTAVIADGSHPALVARAAAVAVRANAPLLLASGQAPDRGTDAELRAAIKALHPGAVLAIGIQARALSALLPGVTVVLQPAALPAASRPARLRQVALLLHQGSISAAAEAARATAAVAGARLIVIRGYDPRSDPAAISALAAARPQRVLAVGAGFGSADLLAYRVAVAETGVQLPGGGQVLFPMRKIVALYGNPTTPALGALGQQGLAASIARAKAVAAQYASLTRVPVIPAFEIIATVAQGSPGPTGSYSYESSVASLRPWVTAASAAGMYVILDLQPGRDTLLSQARYYRSLLLRPNVGLALDPEWKLQPGQLPLRQIGSVSITEVNRVVNWLAALTARHDLPQKLLELHEFRLSMIQDEARLNTRHDDLAIVINMDGQGAPPVKQDTWEAITGTAPRGVYFGWKDFYVKDTPMLGPAATIGRTPVPVLISYQ